MDVLFKILIGVAVGVAAGLAVTGIVEVLQKKVKEKVKESDDEDIRDNAFSAKVKEKINNGETVKVDIFDQWNNYLGEETVEDEGFSSDEIYVGQEITLSD